MSGLRWVITSSWLSESRRSFFLQFFCVFCSVTLYRRQDQDHPQEKQMQKRKMAAWEGLTNSCEKKTSGLIGFPCSPRDSQESSPTPQFKSINSSALSHLHSPALTSIHDHRKNHSLDSEGDQPWDFFGRNDAKAETPVLWSPHAKSWLIGKDFDAGKGWGQEEKGTTEDEMAGWHHWLDGHESEWTPGVVDGQGGLACHKEPDTTERLNWTEQTGLFYLINKWKFISFTLSPIYPIPHPCFWQIQSVLCITGFGFRFCV